MGCKSSVVKGSLATSDKTIITLPGSSITIGSDIPPHCLTRSRNRTTLGSHHIFDTALYPYLTHCTSSFSHVLLGNLQYFLGASRCSQPLCCLNEGRRSAATFNLGSTTPLLRIETLSSFEWYFGTAAATGRFCLRTLVRCRLAHNQYYSIEC